MNGNDYIEWAEKLGLDLDDPDTMNIIDDYLMDNAEFCCEDR